MPNPEWEIPPNLQPHPDDYGFDLEGVLRAVVEVRASVPAEAHTASALGTERNGSGVVIGEGLVLTIGYLVTEAETVWLIGSGGRAVAGYPAAVDANSGFALVQALGQLDLPTMALGESETATAALLAVLAAGGGRQHALETKVIGRQEFAGYWEYLLEEAIFTAPAHPRWSGGALVGPDGRLLGIASLILQQSDGEGRRHDLNMVVPIALLRPLMQDFLRYGGSREPPRPWLGVSVVENEGALVVSGVAEGGPAERAGLQPGDQVLALNHEEVADLATLWRRLWASGPVGCVVHLPLAREGTRLPLPVATVDRACLLRGPRLH
jgi:S1-C subfamily serine protease